MQVYRQCSELGCTILSSTRSSRAQRQTKQTPSSFLVHYTGLSNLLLGYFLTLLSALIFFQCDQRILTATQFWHCLTFGQFLALTLRAPFARHFSAVCPCLSPPTTPSSSPCALLDAFRPIYSSGDRQLYHFPTLIGPSRLSFAL